MGNPALGLIVLSVVALAPLPAGAQSSDDATDKAAADLVADQVREQGYECEEPTKASPDQESDGDTVWTLDCKNTSYRVRLVPDMAAEIEPID